jgi:hypothetical protein
MDTTQKLNDLMDQILLEKDVKKNFGATISYDTMLFIIQKSRTELFEKLQKEFELYEFKKKWIPKFKVGEIVKLASSLRGTISSIPTQAFGSYGIKIAKDYFLHFFEDEIEKIPFPHMLSEIPTSGNPETEQAIAEIKNATQECHIARQKMLNEYAAMVEREED